MTMQTRNSAGSGQTPTKDDVKWREKHQTGPFRPRASLLLNVSPAETKQQSTTQDESPEGMLNQLLINTEVSAERTRSSMRKWQLISLVLGMLLVPTVVVSVLMYSQLSVTGTQQGRLELENQSLKEKLDTAGVQITGFKDEIDTLVKRSIELAGENAKLKSQNITPIAAAPAATIYVKQASPKRRITPKVTPAARQTNDTARVEAIRKGTYPSGATKAEITTVLGKPDRIYKSRSYEQWVYFDRKPGRFWFIGNWLVEVSQ